MIIIIIYIKHDFGWVKISINQVLLPEWQITRTSMSRMQTTGEVKGDHSQLSSNNIKGLILPVKLPFPVK